MFDFVFLFLIVIGVAGIIYIYKKYQQDIKKEFEQKDNILLNNKNKWSKVINMQYLDTIESHFTNFVEKLLRRSRIIVLRIDNNISKTLNDIKKKKIIEQEKLKTKHISFSNLNNVRSSSKTLALNKLKKEELALLEAFINDRNNLESYKNLARFYLNHNEYKNCRNVLLEALAIDPNDKIISDLFVVLYEKTK